MIGYKLYFIHSNGGFADVEELSCLDDAEAILSAERTAPGVRMELWRLGRMVQAFPVERASGDSVENTLSAVRLSRERTSLYG